MPQSSVSVTPIPSSGRPAAAHPEGARPPAAGVSCSLETPSNKSGSGRRRARERDRHELLRSALLAVGLDEEASRVRQCGRLCVRQCMGCGGLAGRAEFHCHNRLCVYCAQSLAAERAKRARALIRRMARPQHVVLTVKNGPDLLERRGLLWRSFQRLRDRKRFRSCFVGGIAFEETTVNERTGEWHVHFHCLLDGSMGHDELRALWKDCTQDGSFVVWIKRADEGAAEEVAKYAAKLNDALLRSPWHVQAYLDATKGKHTYAAFGTCHGLDLDADEELAAEGATAADEASAEAAHHCPYCGADAVMLQRPKPGSVGRVWYRWDCDERPGGWYVLAAAAP